MSFSISYTYKIIDKYTPKLREIQKQTEAFNRKLTNLQKTSSNVNSDLKTLSVSAGRAARSFNRATAKMSGGLGKFHGQLNAAKGKMDRLAKSTGGFVATVGGGIFLKKAVSAGVDYEQSTINLAKVFDSLNKTELVAFQAELAKVGGVIAQSSEEMNKLAFEAGKLGIPVNDVAKFAELTGKVAVAFDTDLGQATTFLADLKTKFDLNNQGLERMLDTINTLADNTTATGSDILNVTQRLSGVFKALKVPPDVAVGLSTIARQIEVTPERAATGMKMFLLRLQDTDKFSPAIAKAMAKDLPGTLDKILSKFRSMDQVARNIAITDLFGSEAAPFIMNLVNSQKLYNDTLTMAGDKIKTTGSMTREFQRQQEAAAFKIQKLKAELKDLAATYGTLLLPYVKKGIAFFSATISKLKEFSTVNPAISKIALALIGLITIAAPVFIGLGMVATAISYIISVATVLAPILVAIGSIFTAGFAPITLLVAGLSMVTIGFSKLWQEGGIAIDWLKGWVSLFDKLLGFNITGWIDSVTKSISNLTDSAFGSLGEMLGFGGGEKSIDIRKQTSNQTRLDGNIRVQAEGGTKVTGGAVKTSTPGNVGFNLAGAL